MERARSGEDVVLLLPGAADREIAVAGLTWVNASLGRFLEGQRTLAERHGSRSMLAAALVSTPPRLEDFQGLELDESDLKELARCRIHQCAVKLFAPDAQRLSAMSDAARQDPQQMNAFFRRALYNTLLSYQRHGNQALLRYADKEESVVGRTELEALLASSPYLDRLAPGLAHRLRNYSASAAPAAEDYFYWSKVSFGLRPTIRLNHLLLHRNHGNARIPWVIASKQLSATHYFQSALELRFVLLPPGQDGRHGFFLLSANRCRSDGLDGFWAGILRRVVKAKTRDGMQRYLHFTRQQTEHPLEAMNATPTLGQ